jgi:5'-3' exonuclease
VAIKSPDTDVAILVIGFQHTFGKPLYFLTGVGNHHSAMDVGAISSNLGAKLAYSLIAVHAISGCDSISTLYGKGKKMFYQLIKDNEDLQDQMCRFGESFSFDAQQLPSLECLISQLYVFRTDINETRYEVFCCSTRGSGNSLPPIKLS